MTAAVFDATPCALGEGPLWHPGLNCLFWFDILAMRLYQRKGNTLRHWQFDAYVSAAGWVDDDTLLIASASHLFRFTLSTGASEPIVSLESDRHTTRSNDGRADPMGGFWIGTMNIDGSQGGGAIYRFYNGELRQLFAPISISNAICFSPDGAFAYFTDTPSRIIHKVALDAHGWPKDAPEPLIDLRANGQSPDGAVTDAAGNLWVALWGAGRMVCFAPEGTKRAEIHLPMAQTTCPAFGGPDFRTLFCTSAGQGDAHPTAGQTFYAPAPTQGKAEPHVRL